MEKTVTAKPASQVDGRHLGLGVVLTIVGGVGWGFSGTCSQLLFSQYGIDPRWLVCMRSLLAGVLFMVVAALFDRKRLVAAVTNRRSLLGTAVFGILGVLTCQTCYLFAIRASDAGTATVLQSLNLLIILAVVCVQMRRRPRKNPQRAAPRRRCGGRRFAGSGPPAPAWRRCNIRR